MSNIERALTDGERNLAFTIFGTSLKYSDVKVYNRKYWPYHQEGAIMTPNGNMYAPETTEPETNTYFPDYSSGILKVKVRAWFIHEMTHVWQHENGMNLVFKGITAFIAHLSNYDAAYPYELNNPSSDLATYGFEQQAAIVGD